MISDCKKRYSRYAVKEEKEKKKKESDAISRQGVSAVYTLHNKTQEITKLKYNQYSR